MKPRKSNPSRSRASTLITALTLGGIAAVLTTASAHAEVLFRDSFSRSANTDLNASDSGQSGSLSPLDWVENNCDGGTAEIDSSSRLVIAGTGSGSSGAVVWPDQNFTALSSFTVTMRLLNGVSGGDGRYVGFSVGQSKAEIQGVTSVSPTSAPGDVFIGYDTIGATKGLAVWHNGTGQGYIDSGSGYPHDISATFTFVDMCAGTALNYEVFRDGVSVGTGSTAWSGTNENYISFQGNYTSYSYFSYVQIDGVVVPITPVVKADNTDDLNLGTSWVGGTVPGLTEVATWDGTVTGADATVLGSDLCLAGIAIADYASPVTIGAGNTLTLGGDGSTVDMSAADVNLTLNCDLALASSGAWDVAASRILTAGGVVSGGYGVTKQGDGTAVLSGANTYAGDTIVNAGTLQLGAGDVIPNGSGRGNVSVDGTLDLNGNSETINGLTGSGIVDNAADSTTSTLTVGDHDQSSTFSGILQNSGSSATLNLEKTGSGALILEGANTYAGTTTISGGMLQHQGSATLTAGNLILGGGVLGLTDDFTLARGSGNNQVQWTGSGGFAANGADRTVTLAGGNVQWNTGSFVPASSALILGHAAADKTVTFANGINFATGGTRPIQVDDGSAGVDAIISGTLGVSGGTNGGFTKTGAGTLQLTNANLYTGDTIVSDGTLQISNLSALGSTSGITLAGGTSLVPTLDGIAVSAPITLGSTGTTSTIYAPTSGAATLTLADAIGGDGNLSLYQSTGSNADGIIVLGDQSTYLGSTTFDTAGSGSSGSRLDVRLGIVDALPPTTVLTLDGGAGAGSGRNLRFDLNGFDQTLAGLTHVTGLSLRNQRVINSGAPATLTVNNTDNYSFGGSVTTGSNTTRTRIEGGISLAKSGVGTFTLVGVHTYTGDTTVSEGILSLDGINPSNESSKVTIAASGATLDLTFTGTDTVDKLFIGTTQMAAGVYGPSATSIPQIINSTGTGTLTVTSGPAGGYADWQTANSTAGGLDQDHDGDGVSNGVEYFLFGSANSTGFTALPGVTNTAGVLSVTWTHAADYTGTYGSGGFVVETSASLANGSWVTAATSGTAAIADTVHIDGDNVTYTFPAGTKNFARLKVTGP